MKAATHSADINIMVTVYFNDDGQNDLTDQALEAADMEVRLGELENHGMEVVGGVKALLAQREEKP